MTTRGLGELALRVNDLDRMRTFYRDVVGLEVFAEPDPTFVFFRVAEAEDGHPQLLALFDRGVTVSQEFSTLDHLAFLIDLAEYDSEKRRLEQLGISLFPKEFSNFHWRSLFFADPEGNTVEFVCYDPSV